MEDVEDVESGCRLVALPAVDGRQHVHRVYAPADALPADVFRQAWYCHGEGPLPCTWDLFDAALTRRAGDPVHALRVFRRLHFS